MPPKGTFVINLDPIDRRVVKLLRSNPRISYQEVSVQIGLSRNAARARVLRLLDSGTLRIIVAPHPRTRGLTVAAELLIDTARTGDEVAAALGERPCLSVGHADGLVTVWLWCHDDAELVDVADRLRADPRTCTVEVFRVVHSLVPGEKEAQNILLDEHDHQLMHLLADDPRASYARLSELTVLSVSAIRARVRRLLEAGAVVIDVVGGSTSMPAVSSRIGITAQGPSLAVAFALSRLPGLTFLAVGHGPYDILARLIAPLDRQQELYQRIRSTPGVGEVRIWRTGEDDLLALLEHEV